MTYASSCLRGLASKKNLCTEIFSSTASNFVFDGEKRIDLVEKKKIYRLTNRGVDQSRNLKCLFGVSRTILDFLDDFKKITIENI